MLVGDLAQLPPVCGKFLFENTQDTLAVPGFHLNVNVMMRTLPISCRDGNPTEYDTERFHKRSMEDSNPHRELIAELLDSAEWKSAIYLFPRKKQVAGFNTDCLSYPCKRYYSRHFG